VTALVKDLLTPLIAAIIGKPDFSAIAFEVNGSKFLIGDFINAILSFILIAAAVYFFVIVPVNALMARLRRGEAPPDPTLVTSELLFWISYPTTQSFLAEIRPCSSQTIPHHRGATNPVYVALMDYSTADLL
jgi:large conductance mechanosensitive channel